MLGSKYPAVSVQSSSSAKRDCTQDFEYLNSFQRIYLCFDNDEPGRKATQEVAGLFDPLKVVIVPLDRKDPNEYLVQGAAAEFSKAWWSAQPYRPEGIVSSWDDFDKILDQELNQDSIKLPDFLPELQEMTDGLRTGESWLWTAREGTGKTEILRALEFQTLISSPHRVAIIHLEERKDRLIRGLAGLQLLKPAHLKASDISNDQVKEALRTLTREDERLHIYSFGGSDDPNVFLDAVRFLVVGLGCRYVFFDHIGFSVTGSKSDDQVKYLDYISTRLEVLVKTENFHLSFVSHVNDNLETRGSRNISKVADVWVHLERPIEHEVPIVRNTTTLTVRKNRPTSHSGPAGVILFDPISFSYRRRVMNELPVD